MATVATDRSDRDVHVVLTEDPGGALRHQRLGGWMNHAFRSLESDRDGRRRESRLDAVEPLPRLLDVVFSRAGRVRPHHGYLPWELQHHPLVDWPGTELLDVVDAVVDGESPLFRRGPDHGGVGPLPPWRVGRAGRVASGPWSTDDSEGRDYGSRRSPWER